MDRIGAYHKNQAGLVCEFTSGNYCKTRPSGTAVVTGIKPDSFFNSLCSSKNKKAADGTPQRQFSGVPGFHPGRRQVLHQKFRERLSTASAASFVASDSEG